MPVRIDVSVDNVIAKLYSLKIVPYFFQALLFFIRYCHAQLRLVRQSPEIKKAPLVIFCFLWLDTGNTCKGRPYQYASRMDPPGLVAPALRFQLL
jgi:hypothetical protein